MKLSLLLLAAVLGFAPPTRAAEDLSLEIIPAQVHDPNSVSMRAYHRPATLEDGADPCFSVLITNTSGRDLTIWREWCSWGYSCLTFTITPGKGPPFEVTRTGVWLWNTPDTTLLRAGRHCVYRASFRDQEWEGFPKDFKAGDITIQAHFAIAATSPYEMKPPPKLATEAADKHVWLGRVSSPPEKVYLDRADIRALKPPR